MKHFFIFSQLNKEVAMNLLFNYLTHLSNEGIRVLPLKAMSKEPTLKNWTNLASSEKNQIIQWFDNKNNNAGILTGHQNRLAVVDVDPKNGGYESLDVLEKELGSLRDASNYIVKTGSGGLHLYFSYPEKISIKSRINFYPGIDIKSDGGYVVSPYSTHPNGNIYMPLVDHDDKNLYVDHLKPLPELLLKKLTQSSSEIISSKHSIDSSLVDRAIFTEGNRNNNMHRIASALRPYLISPDALLLALKTENKLRCSPPLPEEEINNIVKSVEKYPIKIISTSLNVSRDAFHGIAGQLATEVSEISGVSKEALLFQFLICFGIICEQKFYFPLGSKKISTANYLLILGSTGSSRKGTSFDNVKWFFDKYYVDFSTMKLKTGVNSGEGLINCIRDKVTIKELDKNGVEKEIITDQGALSKIVLFLETEFARLLKAGRREGSTVTEIFRNAWDQMPLEINTSQRQIRASEYAISLIAHITPKEFKTLINETDSSNGYLNRFLFCLIGSASPRPFPSAFEDANFNFIQKFQEVIKYIETTEYQKVILSDDAKILYEEYYTEFHYRNEDAFSELVTRAISHLIKLALIYAILDKSNKILPIHLKAAKAIIDHSESSIKSIFEDKIFSRKEKKLLNFLKENSGESLRGLIQSKCFSNNCSKDDLDEIKENLLSSSQIKILKTDQGELWSLVTKS